MQITDFLTPDRVTIERGGSDKSRLLTELARRAAGKVSVPAERICAALMKREELGTTGTGSGVAIPHARMSGIAKPFGILVRLEKPIDFQSIDQERVDIVFLLLLPENAPAAQRGEPLNVLALVARTLRDPEIVRSIRSAKDDGALYRAVTGAEAGPRSAGAP
jgi:nitrogen PTS system EIIA component